MRVSASMYSLNQVVEKEKWTVVDFIQYAKEINLDGVELLDFYWQDNENPEKELTEVKSKLKEAGLAVSAYDVTNNFVKESAAERREEIHKVIRGIQMAKLLDAKVVRVFCGDVSGDITFTEAKNWIVEGLKESAIHAEEAGIYLAVENHGLLAGKSDQVLDVIRKVNSPYVKVTFDTGNFLLVHEDPTEAFHVLKDDIVHVHFKDFREKKQSETHPAFRSTEGVEMIGTIPGDGIVNLADIVHGLQINHYSEWLSIEFEGYEEAKMANEEAVRRLRALMAMEDGK